MAPRAFMALKTCQGLPNLHNRGHLTRPPYNYCYTQVIERRQGVPITNRNSPEHSLSGLRAIYSSKYFIRNHCTIPKACVNVVLLDTQNKYNILQTEKYLGYIIYQTVKNVTCEQTFTLSNKRKITRV